MSDYRGSLQIGGRETDIICGNKAGVKTIFITSDYETKQIFCNIADFNVNDIAQAVVLFWN